MRAREIYDLLGQKRKAFEGFLSATQSLRDIRDFRNNRERISSLIDERQRYIKTINRIDSRITTVRSEDPSCISVLPSEAREKLVKRAAIVKDIAERADQISKECETILTIWRDDIKERLIGIRRSHLGIRSSTNKAYRAGKPKFLDITL